MSADAKTVFITGCSTGIGRAAAGLFAQKGFHVVATARRVETLQDLEETARREKWSLKITACDVTNDESMTKAVDFARGCFGGIHILVNNAGYGAMGPLEAVPMAEARRQMEVNVFGPLRLAQLIVPDMRKARWGRIVNVSSIAGKVALPLGGWYSASKFALEALTDAMRLEWQPLGIDAVSILPGPVKTEFRNNVSLAPIPANMPDWYRRMAELAQKKPARNKFEISAEDVAKAIFREATANRPKTRVILTTPARVSYALQRFFSDRFNDTLMLRFYGMSKAAREIEKDIHR